MIIVTHIRQRPLSARTAGTSALWMHEPRLLRFLRLHYTVEYL